MPKNLYARTFKWFKPFFLVKNNLLTSVHNDTDAADDADGYNRVIGIALLKAFSCAKKKTSTQYAFMKVKWPIKPLVIAPLNHVSTLGSGTNKANVHLDTEFAINAAKQAILPINVDDSTGHKVKLYRYRDCCKGNQLQQSDHNKFQEQPYQGHRPYT